MSVTGSARRRLGAVRSHDDRLPRTRVLRVGYVHIGYVGAGAGREVLFRVRHDADHGAPWTLVMVVERREVRHADSNPAPDHGAIGREAAREHLADHDHRRRRLIVRGLERPAGAQPHAHRREVAGTHREHTCRRRQLAARRRPLGNHRPSANRPEGQRIRSGDATNTFGRREVVENAVHDATSRRRIGVRRVRQQRGTRRRCRWSGTRAQSPLFLRPYET
jgi:hypothetical protein